MYTHRYKWKWERESRPHIQQNRRQLIPTGRLKTPVNPFLFIVWFDKFHSAKQYSRRYVFLFHYRILIILRFENSYGEVVRTTMFVLNNVNFLLYLYNLFPQK